MYGSTAGHQMHYLFIDGGCLRATFDHYCKEFFGGASLPWQLQALTRNYNKTFYYDSLPAQKQNEPDADYDARVAPIEKIFDSLGLINGVHVHLGVGRMRRKKAEQKQVDIMIAVHMLSHSHRRNMQQATLLTSDLDFKPLIDAIVQDGMHVTLWYPAFKTNQDLLRAADARRKFTVETARGLLSQEDRVKYQLPMGISSKSDTPAKNWQLIQEWDCPVVGKSCIYKTDQGFGVKYASNVNPEHFIYRQFGDKDVLLKFCTDIDQLTPPPTP